MPSTNLEKPACRPAPAQTEGFAGLPVCHGGVKVFVITALGLALLLVAVMLLSGDRHGPGRHLSSAAFDAPMAYSARAASFFSADDALAPS
jgi:hypothetical protein